MSVQICNLVCSVQLGLTCSSKITVPPVWTFEIYKTKRRYGQLDKAQVHEQGWSGDRKRLPFGKASADKVCQNGAKEEHLQPAMSL